MEEFFVRVSGWNAAAEDLNTVDPVDWWLM